MQVVIPIERLEGARQNQKRYKERQSRRRVVVAHYCEEGSDDAGVVSFKRYLEDEVAKYKGRKEG